MKKEEKIKFKIERLKSQSDYCKFEIGQWNMVLLGVLALLIAIYIPIVIDIDKLENIIYLTLVLIVLVLILYKICKCFSKKSIEKIERISKEIEELYNVLLKEK